MSVLGGPGPSMEHGVITTPENHPSTQRLSAVLLKFDAGDPPHTHTHTDMGCAGLWDFPS
jgi:hypothetical protein